MTFSGLREKYDIIHELVNAIGDEELSVLSKFLRSRIVSPESYVTLLGETSSGKTTLINGLLGKNLLKTSAAPTTGTIVEVKFESGIGVPEYYAINRNATMEVLDKNTFADLSCKPDDLLSRLQLVVPELKGLSGLRLFDTPGYGSIIDRHEEVLREFIPNSDVLIYVIGYKIGIQEEDFLFMRSIQELLQDDTEIIVVVNRCPLMVTDKDRRIREIGEYARDLFHRSVPVFKVMAEACDAPEILPQAPDLWAYINKRLNSPERQQKLIRTLNAYLDDLLVQADHVIEKQELANRISREEKAALRKCAENLREKGSRINDTLIVPTFDRLIVQAPGALARARDMICDKILNRIDSEKTGRMDETLTFVNVHYLPLTVNQEMREYQRHLELVLDDMNEQVDNYLNQAIADYYSEIELRFASNVELAARFGGRKIAGRFLENGLRQYFAAFGGAGGAGAGVANAAKHLLKKTGELFGKKFSSKTYNVLAHTLKRIGFTSIKAIGNAVAVILEVALVIIDYATWKPKLKNQVRKGLDQWYDKTVDTVIIDLEKLKDENINTLNTIIKENASAYEIEADAIPEDISALITLQQQTHRKLEERKL